MSNIEDLEERSPLDDYFHDVDQDLDNSDISPRGEIAVRGEMDTMQGDEWGDETLVNAPPTPPKGWTGSQQNTPGPSSPRVSSAIEDPEAFAEKFKYLVCSSGLLEKDFVKPLAVPDVEAVDAVEEVEIVQIQPDETAIPGGFEWGWWIRRLIERWNISLAGIVLLGAVIVVLGWKKVIGSLASLLVGTVAAEVWQHFRGRPPLPARTLRIKAVLPREALSPRDLALRSLRSLIFTSDALDISLTSTLSTLTQTPAQLTLQSALHNVCGEMTDHIATATSSLIGLIDESEMKILGEMYDIPLDGRRAPRNRLSAGTESSTTDDLGEIEVYGSRLGNRYPALGIGSVPSPRRDRPIPLQLGNSSSSSILNLSAKTRLSPLLGGESFGMSSTRSLPSHVSTGRHVRHISMLTHDTTSSDDHFTSIPQRTPRLSKRASWDIGHKRRMSLEGDKGLLAAWRRDDQGCMKRSGSGRRVVHEKRITEADEDVEPGWSSTSGEEEQSDHDHDDPQLPYIPTSTSNGLRILSLPSSPTLSTSSRQPPGSHTPKYTSPLTGRRPPPPPPSDPQTPIRHSLTESAIRLAAISHSSPPLFSPLRQSHSPRLSLNISPPTANPKRRSLGNIPYCTQPPSPSISYTGGHDMSRTRSLQSDLQNARTRSGTGGSKSRRTSMSTSISVSNVPISPEMVGNLPSPRVPHRVPSVSPLSTPALQAACLGIHMKRRKVACGLLALRWNEDTEGHWKDVGEVLDKLREGIQVELRKLEEVLKGIPAGDEEIQKSLIPPWVNSIPPPSSMGINGGGFAPVSSTSEKMGDHVLAIQKALGRAWEETVMVQRQLEGSADIRSGISRNWGGLRDELGIMIREIERGKETLSILNDHPHTKVDEARNDDPTPDFLRTWEQEDDTHTARSTSGTTAPTTDISSPNPQIEDDSDFLPEILVPAGADEVFEADLSPGSGRRDNGLSGLGREERMRLMRSARDLGMTLGEFINFKDDAGGLEDLVLKRGREEGGKRVVDELKGVIGLIRDKKDLARGVQEGDGEEKGDSSPFSRFITRERPSSLGPGTTTFGISDDGIDRVDVGGETMEKRDIQEELKKAFMFPRRSVDAIE